MVASKRYVVQVHILDSKKIRASVFAVRDGVRATVPVLSETRRESCESDLPRGFTVRHALKLAAEGIGASVFESTTGEFCLVDSANRLVYPVAVEVLA